VRANYNSGVQWESKVGYSRAVRMGNTIEVSGTVSTRDNEVFGEGDAYVQTKRILTIIGEALAYFGASDKDVVRTRIYVTDIAKVWEAVGMAHGEVFGEIRPATSMVEVSRLIAPEYLVEIEATAMVSTLQTEIPE